MRIRPIIKWLKRYSLYIIISLCLLYIILEPAEKEYFQDGTIETVEIPFFIERKDKNAPKEISGVPLVIYRTWNTNNISKRMNDSIMRSIEKSPEFDNYIYNDQTCLEFIEKNYEPNVANAFKCLRPGAYKADLWRYCILYKNGGVYADIKLELHVSLKDILEKHPKLFVIDMHAPGHKFTTPLWNGLMSSPPGNPVFRSCIDEIILNCKNKDYKSGYLDITACDLLGRMTDKHEGKEFSPALPFKHTIPRQFHYNDTLMFSEYEGYREDREAQQTFPHYSELWNNRDVFDPAIQFE
jgi:hypothetical protein